jgi:hypothetical protein
MQSPRPLDEEAVAALARAAALPLPSERLPLVTGQLRDWLAAANELNRKMADPRHLAVTPITTFTHPASAEPTE